MTTPWVTAKRATAVTALAALALYVTRLCPTLAMQGDSAELVTAAAVWGVPHAPGYPLWTLVAHIFTKLPLFEIAWRVHLTSALYHAGTIFVVGLVIARLTRRPWAVVAGCALLALSRSFLLASLYAGTLPLDDLFFALTFLLGVEIATARSERTLFHLAWIAGLASAHHPLIAMSTPALAILALPALVRSVRVRPSRAGLLLALFVVPFALSLALVPLAASRDPAVSWGAVHDLRSLVHLATRQDYGGPFRVSRHGMEGHHEERFGLYVDLVVASFGVVGILLAARGALARRRMRRVALAMLVGWAATGPLFAMMNWLFAAMTEPTIALAERFTTMSLVPLAVLAGMGVARFEATLGRAIRARARLLVKGRAAFRSALLAPAAALVLAAIVPAYVASRAVDLHEDRRGLAFAHDLLRPAGPGALVFVRGDQAIQAAAYVCVVERACADVAVIAPGELFLPWRRAEVARRHPELWLPTAERATIKESHLIAEAALPSRPVYITPDFLSKDPGFAQRFLLVPDLLLLRLYASDEAREADRATFLERAGALAAGNGCEGCAMRQSSLVHPSFEQEMIDTYASALANNAGVLRALGALADAEALDARAAAMRE